MFVKERWISLENLQFKKNNNFYCMFIYNCNFNYNLFVRLYFVRLFKLIISQQMWNIIFDIIYEQ